MKNYPESNGDKLTKIGSWLTKTWRRRKIISNFLTKRDFTNKRFKKIYYLNIEDGIGYKCAFEQCKKKTNKRKSIILHVTCKMTQHMFFSRCVYKRANGVTWCLLISLSPSQASKSTSASANITFSKKMNFVNIPETFREYSEFLSPTDVEL